MVRTLVISQVDLFCENLDLMVKNPNEIQEYKNNLHAKAQNAMEAVFVKFSSGVNFQAQFQEFVNELLRRN